MRTMLTVGVLAALAMPAFADEEAATAPRLTALEEIVITSIKDEPATAPTAAAERLTDLEIIVSTAPKEQPASHEVDDETAALLEAIGEEE